MLVLSWQMPLLDFLTSGSAAAVLAAGAEAALAGAAAVEAALAGAAGAAGVWAWATRPENASSAVMSEVFNMVCFPENGETAMLLQRHAVAGVDPFTGLYPTDTAAIRSLMPYKPSANVRTYTE